MENRRQSHYQSRNPEEFGVHDTVLIKLLARVALFQH